jgi:DNA-binding NarL/FixJ family response regulator
MPTEAELVVLITKQFKSKVKDIAAHLYLSPRTIETHLSRLRAKLKVEINIMLEILRR